MEKKEIQLNKGDFYYTIAAVERTEIKIKGSSFIASAFPVFDKENAMEKLNSIRKEFFDATHNCYAYKIGYDGVEYRSSDDGEPSGSAGKPMLFAIQKYDYSDVLVVVTRYFGGTKLGVGGLARAYSDATEEVLKICERKTINRTDLIRVFSSYDDLSIVRSIVEKNAVSFREEYRDAVEFYANIPLSHVDVFMDSIVQSTKGRAGAMKV